MKLGPKFQISEKTGEICKKASVPLLIVGIGAYHAYKDYNKAEPDYKNKVLLKDCAILGTTGLGAYGGYLVSKHCLPKNTASLKHFGKLMYEYLESLCLPLGGIIGGIVSGQVMDSVLPIKYTKTKKKKKVQEADINLLREFDYATMSKLYGYAGVVVGSAFENTFSTMSGFSVAKEKGIKNKIRKAVYESGIL